MQVKCSKCDKKKSVSPSSLKRNNRTPESYKCGNCSIHSHKTVKKPNWNQYNKLKMFASIREKKM